MPPQDNQFNFILDPGSQNNSKFAMLQNPKQRTLIAVLFVAVILIVTLIVGMMLFSSEDTSSGLPTIASYQTELARISEAGSQEARDPAVRAKVATISVFIKSDLASTSAYLTKTGTKLSKEQLAAQFSSKTDENLKLAAQRNQYDTVLLETLNELVVEYKQSLSQALQSSPSGSEAQKTLNAAAENIITYEKVTQ